MKKIRITIATLLAIGLSAASFAQQVQQTQQTQQSAVPQAIKYQAIARTANGEAIASQSVSFRISILKNSTDGTPVYQETQTAITNQFGLANISIGQGVVVMGQFNSIEWGNASYFVKIEFDQKGGNEYVFMGTSQLLSVPYSLYSEHAKMADNIPTFPVKAALQASNLQAPFDSPETGMLVYNSSTSGTAPYNVEPGYYYNAGTPQEPKWTLLSSSVSDNQHSTKRAMALGTNTSYGGAVQDNAVGSGVGDCHTGSNNSAFGDSAMNSTMSGSDNTGEGYFVLHKLSTGNYNTAVGSQAMYSNTYGTYNTAVGYEALNRQNFGTSAWNSFNTAIGGFALYNNISTTTTNGYENTAVGYEAGYNNSIGYRNTSVGLQSGLENTTGNANTNVGYGASYENGSGSGITAVGYAALFGTGGNSNSWNTAVGDSALYNITTGDSNTAIGYHTNVTNGTFNNTIEVGYGVTVNASDKAVIGNARMFVIGGQVGWSTLSDGRYKTNVKDYSLGLNFIKSLRPVSYIYTNNNSGSVYDGFIAQEVDQALQKLGMQFSGLCKPQNEQDNYSLRYGDFVVPLVNAVKELDAKNENLQTENNELKEKEAKMENELSELQKTVNSLVQAQVSTK